MSYAIVLFSMMTVYTVYMGYTDGSNAVATCITTKAIPPRVAIYLSAAAQFLTVIAMYYLAEDLSVAATVGSGLIRSDAYAGIENGKGFLFLFVALFSALCWSGITFFLKLPNSTSHTLLGGIIGAGLAAFGFRAVIWKNVLLRIILMIFLAPILSVTIGFLINKLLRKIALHASARLGRIVKPLQWLNVILLSSAISLNDGQKAIGVYLLIISLGIATIPTAIPLTMILTAAGALALGMLFGGYRVIVTIGRKLYKTTPLTSLSSQISTNLVVFTSSALGVPISTGQVISSTVVGIGISERVRGVRWPMVRKIAIGWLVTTPATITFGAIVYLITNLILGAIL